MEVRGPEPEPDTFSISSEPHSSRTIYYSLDHLFHLANSYRNDTRCADTYLDLNHKRSIRMTKRGTFIVFEGLDRCGKSTQVARLEDSLREQGHRVRIQKFPGKLVSLLTIRSIWLRSLKRLTI